MYRSDVVFFTNFHSKFSVQMGFWAVLPLLLLGTNAAPQDTDITYVKMLPVTHGNADIKTTRESRIENLPLIIPGDISKAVKELNDNGDRPEISKNASGDKQDEVIRRIRSDVTTQVYETETTEPPDSATERDKSLELAQETVDYESRTKAPTPRFLSKLSYFQKPDDAISSIATNLVERPGRRRFKSKCRCEKIWNCPKLQITVPRCPNEYFLCCF